MAEHAEADTKKREDKRKADERQKRIDALIDDPDWLEVAACHESSDFAVLMEHAVWCDDEWVRDDIDRMIKSWATWEVDRK